MVSVQSQFNQQKLFQFPIVSLILFGYIQGRGIILYLSGWFQPMLTDVGLAVQSSRPNGILHVSLSGVSQSVAIANQLIAFGDVEVLTLFTIIYLNRFIYTKTSQCYLKYICRSMLFLFADRGHYLPRMHQVDRENGYELMQYQQHKHPLSNRYTRKVYLDMAYYLQNDIKKNSVCFLIFD